MFIGVTERIERDFAQVDLVWNFDRFEVGYFAQNRLKNAEIFFFTCRNMKTDSERPYRWGGSGHSVAQGSYRFRF